MSRRDQKDYSVTVEEGRQQYNAASERAMERVANLGIDVLDERPTDPADDDRYFDGRLPANVHDLDMHELGELYGLMRQHTNWLAGYVAIAKAEVTNKSEQLKLTKARIRKTKTGNKDERDDNTVCDSRYVEANADWLEATEYFEVLSRLHTAASGDLRIISRLVSVKEVEFEQGRRDGNVGRGRGRHEKRLRRNG